jgi:hypothetical protein
MCSPKTVIRAFSSRQSRSADLNALAASWRLSSIAGLPVRVEMRDCPVWPVSDRGFERRLNDSSAVSVFTGIGTAPNAGRERLEAAAHNALRHGRTVSSHTANASAMRRLVQPRGEGQAAPARAPSASPRPHEGPRASSPLLPFSARRQRRFPRHAPTPRISANTESHPRFVGQGGGVRLRWRALRHRTSALSCATICGLFWLQRASDLPSARDTPDQQPPTRKPDNKMSDNECAMTAGG